MNTVRLHFGTWYDDAYLDDVKLDPRPSQKLFNHSPDGFAWGYGGSGPAQLALAILMAAGVDDETAVRYHQDFKFEFLAGLPDRADAEFEVDVKAWVAAKNSELARRYVGLT